METDQLLRNLERENERYKALTYSTGETRIDFMIDDCIRKIKELDAELAKYRRMEQSGEMVRVPCKVGDTVYWKNGGRWVDHVVKGFSIDVCGNFRFKFDYFEPLVSCKDWSLSNPSEAAQEGENR